MTFDSLFRATVKDAIREVLEEMGVGQKTDAPAQLLTFSQAAKRASVSVATIRRWVASGQLPAMGAGRVRRVRVDALMALLSGPRVPSEKPSATITSILDKVRR